MEFKANKTAGDVTSSIDGKHNTSGPTMPCIVNTAETLLHELKAVKNIFDAIHAAYEEVVDREKVSQLQTVTEAYTGTEKCDASSLKI
ncbi:uncharacterized protein V6R79_026116 [Siganus canaliculatus]